MEATEKPKVFVAATSKAVIDKSIAAGASLSASGSPIVGTAGLILGLSKFKKIDALCLLGETRGYLPDPLAAKSVLEILKNTFGFDVDLNGLDEEIKRAETMVTRLQAIEEKRAMQAEKKQRSKTKRKQHTYPKPIFWFKLILF